MLLRHRKQKILFLIDFLLNLNFCHFGVTATRKPKQGIDKKMPQGCRDEDETAMSKKLLPSSRYQVTPEEHMPRYAEPIDISWGYVRILGDEVMIAIIWNKIRQFLHEISDLGQ